MDEADKANEDEMDEVDEAEVDKGETDEEVSLMWARGYCGGCAGGW